MTDSRHPVPQQLSLDFAGDTAGVVSSSYSDSHQVDKPMTSKILPAKATVISLSNFSKKAASESVNQLYNKIFDSIKHMG